MKHRILYLILALGIAAESGAQRSVGDDLKARADLFRSAPECSWPLPAVKSAELRDALRFLYAYMPLPDVADYPYTYHVRQAECALRARKEMPWGTQVPDSVWRHFVLPVRVNNERLDTFRTACYDDLKDRVAGMSMRDAVLEVNHWCHERVTYRPSDSRTSSPLATIRTATGRCGEESTLTVAALRTVGIPARQVYTPRWAHTDDNHAWVEAWVDGEWCFLGACEPEPVLNLGWFNLPASRGMLMHTKVFGRYNGPEDVMARTACHTEINVTANYAPVARTVVRVTDKKGREVQGARVDFRLYNYAELYSVMSVRTDARGRAAITAGRGDLVAWASKDGRFGFVRFTPGRDTLVTLALARSEETPFTADLNLTPPAERNNVPPVTSEQRQENTRRLAEEDSMRTAYTAAFPDSAATARFCRETGMDEALVRPLVVKSCGNHAALLSLLRSTPTAHRGLLLRLLGVLTDKDLRDFDPATLADHLAALPEKLYRKADDVQLRYVCSPRTADEPLTPWRGYFHRVVPASQRAAFAADPRELARWIADSIATDTVYNPSGLWLSPEGAWRTRRADLRSKGLLFVAMARTAGTPARIDEVTGKVQYMAGGEWHTVAFTPQRAALPAADVKLDYEPRRYMENPKYYTHFTLSRMTDGRPVLQNYSATADWSTAFARPARMDAGTYLLTSGTRMADGSVLVRLNAFRADAGRTTAAALVMRSDNAALQVIGSFNSENRYRPAGASADGSLLATTGRGYYVCALLRANHEPSNHLLHDLERVCGELEAWGRPIVLLFPSAEELAAFETRRGEFPHLPSTVRFGVDNSGAVAEDLRGGALAGSGELPLLVLADTFNRVVFAAQGYTIGTGGLILDAVSRLGTSPESDK